MTASKEKIQQTLPFVDVTGNVRINYNIAPTQHAYVITNDSPNRLQYCVWGLIPYWSEEGKNSGKLINARREGITSKPSFRLSIRQRRCLVLADSFYEWKKEGKQKVPYRIQLKESELMVMAGIWDEWYDGNYRVKSFSIITTPPNKEMSTIHSRMPALLTTQKECQEWLAPKKIEQVMNMLSIPADGLLKRYKVSAILNSVKSNSPQLHRALPETPTLF